MPLSSYISQCSPCHKHSVNTNDIMRCLGYAFTNIIFCLHSLNSSVQTLSSLYARLTFWLFARFRSFWIVIRGNDQHAFITLRYIGSITYFFLFFFLFATFCSIVYTSVPYRWRNRQSRKHRIPEETEFLSTDLNSGLLSQTWIFVSQSASALPYV